jgi:hypothetical protein
MTRPVMELKQQTSLELAGQHQLVVTQVEGGHSVQIVTPRGATPVVIEVTSQGITMRIDGPGIALRAAGALSLSAETLTLEGRQGVTIASGGDLDVGVAGDLTSRARAQVVRADAGSVDIKASDDVKLVGERVMVNCDETVDRHFRGASAIDGRDAAAAPGVTEGEPEASRIEGAALPDAQPALR